MSAERISFFLVVWIGHSALWLVTMNIVYSQPLPRWALRTWRAIVAGLVAIFPIAYWTLVTIVPDNHSSAIWWIAHVYVGLCCLNCVTVIPLVTVRRWLRTRPPQLVGQTSHVIDTASALGGKPDGDGRFRWMARLPLNQVYEVEFTQNVLYFPDLPPEWDNLSILQLSDLHFCGTPDRAFFEYVFDQCMKQGVPDILAITGDFVDTDRHHRWIFRLLSRLQWNDAAFAILGNHDSLYDDHKIRRRLIRRGVTMLGNRWEVLQVRGHPLLAVGHEGPWFEPAPDLSKAPPAVFRLCLSHTPDNICWAMRNNIDLMLSGHCHGGQIRLPLFGSLFVPSKYSRSFDHGLFWQPPTLLNVNRGLSGKEPLRYLCRPEVTRFVLRCGAT